jgi:hypothetical protein
LNWHFETRGIEPEVAKPRLLLPEGHAGELGQQQLSGEALDENVLTPIPCGTTIPSPSYPSELLQDQRDNNNK